MSRWWTEMGARLIVASRAVDRAYDRFEFWRAELVLAFSSHPVLDRFNDLAYGETKTYRPDTASFRQSLFHWEEEAVRHFFPPPPARILVGGAGGGREPFALARQGYEVVAFDPSPALARLMAESNPDPDHIAAYRAGYEDLPQLYPAREGGPAGRLDSMGPFDAAILGWSSFSHLRTEEQRLHSLRSFAAVTRGPVLVSFFPRRDPGDRKPRLNRLRRLVRSTLNQDPGNTFGIGIGFYHRVSNSELSRLAAEAGMEVTCLKEESDDVNWPHAILTPVSVAARGASGVEMSRVTP